MARRLRAGAVGDSPARLDVHNVSGRLVVTLIDEVRDGGENTVEWNGRSATGGDRSSGAHFLRVVVGEKTATAKGIVLKQKIGGGRQDGNRGTAGSVGPAVALASKSFDAQTSMPGEPISAL